MSAFADRLSDFCGRLAAWLFVIIGAMITYEVVARYVFTAPTIWAEELSRFGQIWATYLGAAYVLRHRELIAIRMAVDRLGARARFIADAFSLVVIAVFSCIAIWYGAEITLDSLRQGRSTGSMLGVPQWLTEAAIPFGFALLLLQCLVELLRLPRREAAPGTGAEGL